MINVQEITPSEGTLSVKPHEKDPFMDQNNELDTANPKEVAEYSAELLTEIRDMAGQSGLTFLAYLTQVALEEAKIQAGKPIGR
ncbi:MAG: hypothetical protein KTR19_12065 [Hyphomicrobiales bacterium]|nr:hypothetical protein [Hyphomicrobiales bacterium]